MRSIAAFVFLVFISCNSDSDPDPVISSKATFTGIVNHVNYSITESDSGYVNLDSTKVWSPAFSRISTADSTNCLIRMYLGGFIVNDPPGYPKKSIRVSFVRHFHNSQLMLTNGTRTMSADQYAITFSVGPKPYSTDYLTRDGIFIQWYDASGALWTSNRYLRDGSNVTIPVIPNFSNASFRIDKSIRLTPGGFTCNQYIETSFNCTLYNHLGDSIEIANGKLKGVYRM